MMISNISHLVRLHHISTNDLSLKIFLNQNKKIFDESWPSLLQAVAWKAEGTTSMRGPHCWATPSWGASSSPGSLATGSSSTPASPVTTTCRTDQSSRWGGSWITHHISNTEFRSNTTFYYGIKFQVSIHDLSFFRPLKLSISIA